MTNYSIWSVSIYTVLARIDVMREWAPYVPVAVRRRRAADAMKKRAAKGHPVDPVVIEGRTIAKSPWGKSWCSNLEAYSDFSNRLPRGRTYARNGSIVDLQIQSGKIKASVAGSSLYHCTLSVTKISKKRWKSICADCHGGIDSLVELLRGRLDEAVMKRLCRQGDGLFPTPKELTLGCDCPDWADMCKHVAAVLYGVGNRLDHQPELLFKLRGVDASELIASAGNNIAGSGAASNSERILETDDIGDLFGLDFEHEPVSSPRKKTHKTRATKASGKKSASKDGSVKKTANTKRSPPSPKTTIAAKTKEHRNKDRSKTRSPAPRSRDLYGKLYRHLAKTGSLNSQEAQIALGANAADLREAFKRLVSEGHARVSGKARGTRYHCEG